MITGRGNGARGAAIAAVIVATLWGLLGALSSQAGAQTYLYNRADLQTGNNPSAVVFGDFNGDGIPDLAVANFNDNTVSILLGKPDGTFAKHVDYATGPGPVALVAADFNGDGKLDLAVVNSQGNTVSILLGEGDGTFEERMDFPTGNQPVGIVAADFNGDKKVDLAVANQGDSTVSILLGNGDGTFQSQTAVPVLGHPQAIQGGDFNGDGKEDLVVLGAGVSVLLSNGDGTFRRIDTTSLPSFPSTGLAVGDFNGDGKLDVVVGDTSPLGFYQPQILLGNGDGTFQAPLALPSPGASADDILAADFNHDGKLDLAFVGHGVGSAAAIELGNGDGTFQFPIYALPFISSTPTTPAVVGDFNGDGLLDLAEANPGTNSVSILLGDGDGTFGKQAVFAAGATGSTGPEVVTDANGDGKPDVVVVLTGSPTGKVAVFLGNGDGTLDKPIYSPLSNTGATVMVAADFNGDGKMDLAVDDGSNVAVLLGNGDGTFQAPLLTNVGANLTVLNLAAGDFNGDGKVDLAAIVYDTSKGKSSVIILLGHGDGTFAVGASYGISIPLAGSGSGSLVAADFNKDGKLDLALTGPGANFVAVQIGNGDGTFQAPILYPIHNSDVLLAADVNTDGKLDLVGVSGTGTSVLLGNGDGTFQGQIDSIVPGPGFSNGYILSSAVIGDFNGDGKLDVGTYAGGTAVVLLGNGDGTFGTPLAYTEGSNFGYAATGDFNADGTADLALATVSTSPVVPTVSLLLSAPMPSFNPVPLSFGNQEVGASTTQNENVYNRGTAALNISSVVASGDFSEASTCAQKVAISSGCLASVTFSPAVAGSQAGALTFVDNAATITQVVALTGTGVVPAASLSATSLNFGNQGFGTTSTTQTIALTNSGKGTLTITSFSFSGVDQGDFAQTNTCGASLASGANCAIMVTFMPLGLGTRTAVLAINDNNNGVNDSAETIALTGTGAIATPSITWATPAPIVYGMPLSTAQLNATSSVQGTFAYNPPAATVPTAGAHALTVTFTPTNTTDYTTATQTVQLSVTQAALVVTAASASRNYGSPNPPLAGSITGLVNNDPITAAYSTTATSTSPPGTYPITPTLSDPNGRLPNYAVTLNNGILRVISAPVASVSTASLSFGSELMGGTASAQSVSLRNTGTAGLTVTSILASGDFAATNNCGMSVAAGASCLINVSFKPTAGGSRTGTLTITDSAAGSPQMVALAGSGEDFSFGVAAGSSPSATVNPGGTAAYKLSIGGLGGLNQAIAFSCQGAPSESTCAVTPASVTPGTTPSTVTVTVSTTEPSMLTPPVGSADRGDPWRAFLLASIALLLVMLGKFLRRRQLGMVRLRGRFVGIAAVLLLAAVMMTACGGMGGGTSSGSNPGTPVGNYTLRVSGTVTSASATLTHQISLTLNVQ